MRSMAFDMSDVARRVSDRRRIEASSSEIVIGPARKAASSVGAVSFNSYLLDMPRHLSRLSSRMIDRKKFN